MSFWLGLVIGWFTAAPLIILALALVSINKHD